MGICADVDMDEWHPVAGNTYRGAVCLAVVRHYIIIMSLGRGEQVVYIFSSHFFYPQVIACSG